MSISVACLHLKLNVGAEGCMKDEGDYTTDASNFSLKYIPTPQVAYHNIMTIDVENDGKAAGDFVQSRHGEIVELKWARRAKCLLKVSARKILLGKCRGKFCTPRQ